MKKKQKRQFLSVILARKNSVRIKNKNLKKINGKTLIEHTVLFAKKFENISNILLSTDSKKIIHSVRKFKNIILHNREKKYSGSKSESLVLLKRIIKWYELKYEIKLRGVILLQPTTPFRNKSLLNKTLESFINNKFKFNYFSVSQNDKKNNLVISDNNLLKITKKKDNNCYINGSFYIFNKSKIKKNIKESILSYKSKGVKISSIKYSIDIDEYDDLKLARTYKK